MTPSDFIRSFLMMFSNEDYNKASVKILAAVADSTKNGWVWLVPKLCRESSSWTDICNAVYFLLHYLNEFMYCKLIIFYNSSYTNHNSFNASYYVFLGVYVQTLFIKIKNLFIQLITANYCICLPLIYRAKLYN